MSVRQYPAPMLALGGSVALPPLTYFPGLNNLGGQTMTAATHLVAIVCQMPAGGTVDAFEFKTATVTTGCTIDGRVETVSAANGDPTGALVAAGANGAVVIAAADDNVTKSVTIGTPPTVAKGDRLALVLAVSAGVPNLTIAAPQSLLVNRDDVYSDKYDGAAWTKSVLVVAFCVTISGVRYAILGSIPGQAFQRTGVDSADTPDEYGNEFTPQVGMRVTGLWSTCNVAGDTSMVLYNSASTVLGQIDLDKDIRANVTSGRNYATLATPVVLSPGKVYRVSILPGATAVALGRVSSMMANNTAIESFTDWNECTRTNAGAWTSVLDGLVAVGIIVDAVEQDGERARSFAG